MDTIMQRQPTVYMAGQAAKAAGVAYHRLNYWATTGIVVPSVAEGKGYGGVRAYSFADVVALKVAARMKASGFPIRTLQNLVTAVQQWDEESPKTYFVGDEKGSVAAFDEAGAFTALQQKDLKGLTWFVNISDIVQEVKSRLGSLSQPMRGKSLRTA
jgi:DNA-binding transcriptional MerR regulator